MANQWKVEGKRFLITGGASGLGALYAEAYLKEGAKSIAILDIAEEAGRDLAARLNNIQPGTVTFIKCDVSNEEAISDACNKVVKKYKQVDVIINNAGIMNDAPGLWRTACDVNWQGVVSFTMKGLKHMRKDEGGAGGTIINISSNAALIKWRHLPIYSGSKMAVLHFSQSLAVEPFFEQTGVRILTMCFGGTDTPLLANLEKRTYDGTLADEIVEMYGPNSAFPHQRPESAVAACIKVFNEGANGSIWTSRLNKPAEDITPTIDKFFKELEKILR